MNETELEWVKTSMRQTKSKQLYTRYQVIYLHLNVYKNVEIARMVTFAAQTIGTYIRNYKGIDLMN